MSKILKVLVVDDSPSVRELLEHMVNSEPDMHAVGLAKDGLEAVQMTHDLHPDVILMDLIMPHMDGLEATSEIMHAAPTPIVLITASLDVHETGIAFRALSLGALAVHLKPVGPAHADHAAQSALLLNKLRLMADVQVIRHRKGRASLSPALLRRCVSCAPCRPAQPLGAAGDYCDRGVHRWTCGPGDDHPAVTAELCDSDRHRAAYFSGFCGLAAELGGAND